MKIINDDSHRKLSYINILFAGLLGMMFCYYLVGMTIIKPQSLSWILNIGDGDAVQHFMGWSYFCAENWHFPLGKISSLNYPTGTSIIYTDSIPLFALPFKIFAPLLPKKFQYFGLWILGCYALQAIFGWLLATQLSKKFIIKFAILLMFIISPIVFNRITGHHSLTAHWELLAALFLYFQSPTKKTNLLWIVLCAVSLLTHAYLCLMVLLIWLAAWTKYLLLAPEIKAKFVFRHILINIIVLISVGWLAGYFGLSLSNDIEAGGYKNASMNLLGPIDPATFSPLLIKRLPSINTVQQFEGFNYVGLGILFLMLLAFYEMIKKPPLKTTVKPWLPLLVVSIFFTFYSLSNQITFGDHVLFTYPIPSLWNKFTATFRSSGRFFWPSYYVLMLLCFTIIIRRNNIKTSSFILLVAAILQILDLSAKIRSTHHLFHHLPSKPFIFNTPFWEQAPKYYKKIMFVPGTADIGSIKNYDQFVFYAATNHMPINIAYLARGDYEAAFANDTQLLQSFKQGHFSKGTIYIILKPELLQEIKPKLSKNDQLISIEAYTALVPDYYQITEQK